MTLDLKPAHKELVKKLLQQYASGMIVWAYGSRVRGDAVDGSDLDLVIINPINPVAPFQALIELREAFSESNLPISVDVMDWALLPASFQEEISKAHIVIKPVY